MAYVQPELADAVRHAGACLGLDVAALERLSEPSAPRTERRPFLFEPVLAQSREWR